MDIAKVTKSLILGSAILVASTAFAANKAQLHLSSPASISGTQLKPGQYELKWDGTGDKVQLTVMQGSKLMATVPAHMIELKDKPSDDSAVLRAGAGGALTVAEIHVSGKKQALAIGDDAGSGYGSSQ